MLLLMKLKICIIIFIFSFKNLFAADIPIIVIAPGKTTQSYSTVGSAVSVIDNSDIEDSQYFFLADVLNNNSTGINLFQMGGHGTNAGIQLRGLPKRYSTVYIDGIKMSDPSSSDNSFYSENIMKHSIDRVEVLRGAQSSLYGSNAIGGTVNIFTKKGKEDSSPKFEISNGSNNTKNLFFSIDNANSKFDYYLGLNKFVTDGISAMNDNNENDEYRNDGIIASYGYKFNKNFKLENYLRYTDAYLNYDTVNNTKIDENTSDNLEGTYSLRFIYDNNNFKNKIFYNKTYIERATINYANEKTTYLGYRDALNLIGEYNFNLDSKIVYGLESEFDAAKYRHDNGGDPFYTDESIFSQYLDYQFRPLEKLYSTIGFRRDEHTTAGEETTGRATIAYKLDNNTKIRSSFGTGIRFPTLYDYFYGDSAVSRKEDLYAEKSKSFDIGYETYLDVLNLNLNVSFFKLNYEDPLVSQNRTGWGIQNATGDNTSEGIELSANWKPNNVLSIGLDYTFTDSFDSSGCENPDKGAGDCKNYGSSVDEAMVRVPRHAIVSNINYRVNNKFKNSLLIKYIGETRDYGNVNNSWVDQILDDYATFDVVSAYRIWDAYDINFSIRNMFDQDYEQAWQYSTMGRSLNFAIKKVF